jgi:mono/diheme cytochrome c family protein
MHEGARPDGARLYPAFPYNYFTRMPRADTDAIYAYLGTLVPVTNRVDRNTLPFPFNIRASMLAWNALFFRPGEFRPDPARSAEWSRGAYIVEGPGHYGACHTPKNRLGGDRDSQHLAGGPLQGWFAASLTADERTGLGTWSTDEIVEYLRTRRNARSAASGLMAEVVEYSTALMTEPDVRAIATYLREPASQVAAPRGRAPIAAEDARMKMGEAIYLDRCMACHTRSGEGVPNLFPRLAGSQVVQQEGSETVLQGVRAAHTPHAPTSPAMPAFGWRLNDDQAAAVTTCIRNAWGQCRPHRCPRGCRPHVGPVARSPLKGARQRRQPRSEKPKGAHDRGALRCCHYCLLWQADQPVSIRSPLRSVQPTSGRAANRPAAPRPGTVTKGSSPGLACIQASRDLSAAKVVSPFTA